MINKKVFCGAPRLAHGCPVVGRSRAWDAVLIQVFNFARLEILVALYREAKRQADALEL